MDKLLDRLQEERKSLGKLEEEFKQTQQATEQISHTETQLERTEQSRERVLAQLASLTKLARDQSRQFPSSFHWVRSSFISVFYGISY
jgi:hypothetical protein